MFPSLAGTFSISDSEVTRNPIATNSFNNSICFLIGKVIPSFPIVIFSLHMETWQKHKDKPGSLSK